MAIRLLYAFPLVALAWMIPVSAVADATNGAWALITPSGSPPTFRRYFAAFYDSHRQQLFVDGGWPNCPGDTRVLTLSGAPSWGFLASGGPRNFHPGVYDPLRGRAWMFGWADCQDPGYDNQVLVLTYSPGEPLWTSPTTAGTSPSGRAQHSLLYDPLRDRLLVFGGQTSSASFVNDVWQLDLIATPTWTQILPAGTPPSPRRAHTAIYDPVRDVMLVFGGNTATGGVNDVWQLTLGATPTWSALPVTGTPPDGRYRHSAIYDPVRDRMVVFGGISPSAQTNDLWSLSLAGTPTWSQLAPAGTLPLAREGHAAIYDAPRDRMIVYGAHNPPEDLWALEWATVVGVEPAPSAPQTIALRSRPSPAAGDVTVEFALPRRGTASMRVYDVHGRLVRALFEGEAPAGERTLSWDRRTSRGERTAPGVYLLRLRFEGSHLTRRLVLTD